MQQFFAEVYLISSKIFEFVGGYFKVLRVST